MRITRAISVFIIHFLCLTVLAQADFIASVTSGCSPLKVKFTIDSSSIDVSTIEYLTWDFGFGNTVNSLDPDTVTYEEGGQYTVTLTVNGNVGEGLIKSNYITVYQTVDASFRAEEYAEGYNYRFIPTDEITDTSTTYFYLWSYRDSMGTIDTKDYIITYLNQRTAIDSFTFSGPGRYNVQLIIDDTHGCSSRYRQDLIIREKVVLPNVFVAGTDKFFVIDPEDAGIILSFTVFSRSGAVVFRQKAPVINWDGRTSNGLDLSTAVYYYVLEPIQGDPTGRFKKKGFIHLFNTH